MCIFFAQLVSIDKTLKSLSHQIRYKNILAVNHHDFDYFSSYNPKLIINESHN